MKYDRYNSVYEAEDLSILEFMSTGRNGIVRKRIIFAKTETILHLETLERTIVLMTELSVTMAIGMKYWLLWLWL